MIHFLLILEVLLLIAGIALRIFTRQRLRAIDGVAGIAPKRDIQAALENSSIQTTPERNDMHTGYKADSKAAEQK